MGGHSLIAVRMFSQIEKIFGVNLPLASLFHATTVEHLARLIEQQGQISTWPSLVELQPLGSKLPFFCIHGITGDILWFRELAMQLAPDQPFYGIQARGLDGVQSPFDTIEAMAAQYLAEIRIFQPTGPYFLGGASFGGTVALELSRQLLAQGQQVALLAMFDHAPLILNGYQKQSVTNKVRHVLALLDNIPHWLNSFLTLSPATMAARLRRKLNITRKMGGLDFDSNAFDASDLIDYAAELPEHRQRLIEAHHRAINSYQPSRYPGQVVLLRARAQSLFYAHDPAAVWRYLADEGVDMRMIPGSHEGMFKAPYVEALARELRDCLARAQQG